MTRERAGAIRAIIEAAMELLPDEAALEAVTLHSAWKSGTNYAVGCKAQFGGSLYRCLIAHTAHENWKPDTSPSLWTKVVVVEGTILPWEQPDSTNGYMRGNKVSCKDKIWVCTIDNNVWEPGIYGWTVLSARQTESIT